MEGRRTKTRLKPTVTSLSWTVVVLVTVCTCLILQPTLSNADDDENADSSHFALRPFQASPHITRRQDGGHLQFDPINLPDSDRDENEPMNLVPILTAPVPRGSNIHHKQPSFQRIRLNKHTQQGSQGAQPARQTFPPQFAPSQFSPSESPLANFQRIASFPQRAPQTPAFRAPPTFPPEFSLAPPPPLPPTAPPRQSFRRVKPSSSGTRRIKIKTASPVSPAHIAPSRPFDEPNSRRVSPTPLPTSDKLRGRGPINAQDDDLSHKDNALDNEDESDISSDSSSYFGNRVNPSEFAADNGILAIESLSRGTSSRFVPSPTRHQQPVPTPTIPLTYYTTFTYLTTVVRGQHTALLSREQVSSSTKVQPIDRSIVTAIEFNDGYIPLQTSSVALGTKTKGLTTTIYNMASRVQIFNDDLYKVIHATRTVAHSLPPVSSQAASSSQIVPTRQLESSQVVPTRHFSSSQVVSSRQVHSSQAFPTRQSPSRQSPSRQQNVRQWPTNPSSSLLSIEPTQTFKQPSSHQTVTPNYKLDDLENAPKKFLSKFTYFYTFIDGAHTQYSTRTEESTANFAGNLATLSNSLATSIDSDGLLQVLSTKSNTVSLASRAHGHLTTMVNLALNNYIKFDNVRAANVDIKPTKTNSRQFQTRTPILISSTFEESSLKFTKGDSSLDLVPSDLATPKLSDSLMLSTSPVLSSSPVSVSTSSTRSRIGSSRRPGVRVKVKPIRSKLVNHLSKLVSSQHVLAISSFPIVSSSVPSSENIASALSPLSPSPSASLSSIADSASSWSPLVSSQIEPSTPSPSFVSSSTAEVSFTPSIRKKVAYTVRRPGFSGVHRFFTRRPSSYLVQRSSHVVSPTLNFISPSSSYSIIAMTSSSVQPRLSSSQQRPELSSAIQYSEPSSSGPHSVMSSSVILPTPSFDLVAFSPASSSQPTHHHKSSKHRKVVLTRIVGNGSNNWNPLYNTNRVRISSRKVFKSSIPSESLMSPSSITPTASIETVFETTTHTVPFTLGTNIVYTTVEETNRRVITHFDQPIDSSQMMSSYGDQMASPSISPSPSPIYDQTSPLASLTSSFVPDLSRSITRVEPSSSYNLEPIDSSVVVETRDVLTTSTLYSTMTYYATLFNGTQTLITPLEETKTEYLTLREPVTFTRTIMPTLHLPSSISPSSTISPDGFNEEGPYLTETISTHTTLTHFITLFSGTRTILSSIEEISPTVVTRTQQIDPTNSLTDTPRMSSDVSSSQYGAIQPSLSSSSFAPTSSSPVFGQDLSEYSTPTPSPSPSLESVLIDMSVVDSDSSITVDPTMLTNEETPSTATADIQSGSVIELNDLLKGVQDAGQIGEAIKDIVNNIVTNQNQDNQDNFAANTTPQTTDSPQETTTLETSTPVSTSISTFTGRPTPTLKNRQPIYVVSQNLPKYFEPSSENKNRAIFSTQSDGDQTKSSVSTRFVTSIDKSTKTLTITSTKVYYTRDSPLTITNVLTTTLPPITYVSTIIGSKTILGTYNSITPTKTETSSIQMATSAVVVSSTAVTNRPRLHRPKNTEPQIKKAKVTPFLTSAVSTTKKPTKFSPTKPQLAGNFTTSFEMALCNPICNLTNKEYCKEGEDGRYSCECRPGFVRRPSDNLCQEIKNYLVMVRVSKTAESEVGSTSITDKDLQNYARVARRQVAKTDGIAGLQVLSIDRIAKSNSAMVNFSVQLNRSSNDPQNDLFKKLEPLGHVEKVVDFDECSSIRHNDCSPRARCINEPGSYKCQCIESYIDLDQSLPGRLCVSEVKSCDYCYGRGDCWRHHSNTVCRCHPMFIGRRCEINGLLLAILVPILAILVIVAIVGFLYCSRKLRQRNRRFKNLAAYGPVAVIGGTLDRKAMLETSSESSDPQHRSPHYTSESNPASARNSLARRHDASRRESEPSLDRSLTSYSITGSNHNSLPPQILIPRARPPYTLHRGQVYMW